MSKRVLHEVQIDHQKLIDRHPSHRKRMTWRFPDPNSSHLTDSATFYSRFSVGDVNRKQSQDHSVRGQLWLSFFLVSGLFEKGTSCHFLFFPICFLDISSIFGQKNRYRPCYRWSDIPVLVAENASEHWATQQKATWSCPDGYTSKDSSTVQGWMWEICLSNDKNPGCLGMFRVYRGFD